MRSRMLQRIMGVVGDFLTDVCDIEREVVSTGTMGEPLHTWALMSADVQCRVIRAGQRNDGVYQQVGDQEALVETFRVICPVGTEFKVNDRIVMQSDNAVYQVVDVIDRLTEEVFVSAIVKRVRT